MRSSHTSIMPGATFSDSTRMASSHWKPSICCCATRTWGAHLHGHRIPRLHYPQDMPSKFLRNPCIHRVQEISWHEISSHRSPQWDYHTSGWLVSCPTE